MKKLRLSTSDKASHDALVASVQKIVSTTTLISLATTNEDSSPHINTAYFAVTGIALDLIFLSPADSQHIKNLSVRPKAAAALYPTGQPWDGEKMGLQLFGRVSHIEKSDAKAAHKSYSHAFPSYASWLDSEPKETRDQLMKNFYVFQTAKIKVFDESQFGEEVFIEAEVLRR